MSKPNEQPGAERPAGPESLSADDAPSTQAEGALVPPPRKPPTALGASAESFPPNPARFSESWRRPGLGRRTAFTQLATEIFNTLDAIADRIAEELRLR
ncbi:MAG: hypothetical protein ACJ796_05530 [Gemmatimonadaceae bacterium]